MTTHHLVGCQECMELCPPLPYTSTWHGGQLYTFVYVMEDAVIVRFEKEIGNVTDTYGFVIFCTCRKIVPVHLSLVPKVIIKSQGKKH